MIEIHARIGRDYRMTLPAVVRRRLAIGPHDSLAFAIGDDGTVHVRRVSSSLDAILGSIPAIPGESLDLDREIDAAAEAEIARKAQRPRRS